jgi:hypothetical protein
LHLDSELCGTIDNGASAREWVIIPRLRQQCDFCEGAPFRARIRAAEGMCSSRITTSRPLALPLALALSVWQLSSQVEAFSQVRPNGWIPSISLAYQNATKVFNCSVELLQSATSTRTKEDSGNYNYKAQLNLPACHPSLLAFSPVALSKSTVQ